MSNNSLSQKYDEGTLTKACYEEFFNFDFGKNDCPYEEFIENLNHCNHFIEGIEKRLQMLGYGQEITGNRTEMAKVVKKLFSEANIEFAASINNWIKNDSRPSYDSRGRENVYKLCFALKMDHNETAEFFIKYYLDRPFNSKTISEAVYLFCLKNKLSYSAAEEMIKAINSSKSVDSEVIYHDLTNGISDNIINIESNDQFIAYIVENRNKFLNSNNSTGINEVKKLLNECMKESKSIDSFLDQLYELDTREIPIIQKKDIKYDKVFPKYITMNFPQKEQLKNIINDVNPSYDSIRKALIILHFYNFFSSVGDNYNALDEYEDSINDLLSTCGYVQFYKRNPFDLMLYYCAMSATPLDTLRDFIYYITVEDSNT